MTRLGVVTGLAAEARCLSRGQRRFSSSIHIHCASGNPAAAAEALVAGGAQSLMSFGIAGGLDGTLLPGRVIVASAVIDGEGERIDCHPLCRGGLLTSLDSLSPLAAPLMGLDSPLVTVADKRACHARYGATAVDMESHAVARVAARARLPFAAIRAIADTADQALPSAALAGFNDQGEVRIAPVLWELARRPWQLPDLIGIALDSRKAMAALGRCAETGGLLFGGG